MYIPYVFQEKPELTDSFSGFTFYKNTVSGGPITLCGSQCIYGGYEYMPLKINERSDETLEEKQNESSMVMPLIFLKNGFDVTLADPMLAGHSVYDNTDISVNRISGKYSDTWLAKHPDIKLTFNSAKLQEKIIYYSVFRSLPIVLRDGFYNDGTYLVPVSMSTETYDQDILNDYSAFDMLPAISTVKSDQKPTFTLIWSNLTHSPFHFYQAPEYMLAPKITNKGTSVFATDKVYHQIMAAFVCLARYLDFLKNEGVYDNTRIILVSDHGLPSQHFIPEAGDMTLPDSSKTYLNNVLATLLVKDFNSRGVLQTDNTFMTNADVPYLATQNIINNPINPFSGKELTTAKEDGVTIISYAKGDRDQHNKNTFKTDKGNWLFVRGDVYDIKNWKIVE